MLNFAGYFKALFDQQSLKCINQSGKYMKFLHIISLSSLLLLLFSCGKKEAMNLSTPDSAASMANVDGLFTLLKPEETGVSFSNDLVEDEHYNCVFFESIYNGAGCAVLDVNNDDLLDLFFVSNQGKDKLYLNKGNFKFEDISASAGIEGGAEWSASVTIADVNADGYDDIYISCHLKEDPELRRNKLYVNQKNLSFKEEAKAYGLDDSGYSIHAAFFDYDVDGDLDVLVINQPMVINEYQKRDVPMDNQYSSHLYQNTGNNHFTDITKEAGLLNIAFTLSTAIGDISNDGYPDIYMANDYDFPDNLYINMQNGTFRDLAKLGLQHMSQFSMGSDVADFNNDGWLDVVTADMVAEDHYRNKTNMASMNPKRFWQMVKDGNHYQYMFNALQLSNGNGSFSEIAQLAGVSKTDWSWTAFFSDFDNDAEKDLFISNGYLRDIRNKDFSKKFLSYHDSLNNPKLKPLIRTKVLDLIGQAPSVKIQNYMYRNEGNLQFGNVTRSWGMDQVGFSQGASYADLDNDGDLDLIMNNMNDPAFIYKNNAEKFDDRHYLRIKLEGNGQNLKSFGARAVIYTQGKMQLAELTNVRGYMSTSEPVLHFGLAQNTLIDSLLIRWPSGATIKKYKVKVDQLLVFKEKEAELRSKVALGPESKAPFTVEVTDQLTKDIRHTENDYDDYRREILIPHKLSSLGPALAVADVNGDGNEDFYLGGSVGSGGKLLVANQRALFDQVPGTPMEKNKSCDEVAAVFFDAEGDGDQDLLVAGGGNEFPDQSAAYQTHLYLNQGAGQFTDATDRLPALRKSIGAVAVFDLDADKDMDLFLGARLVPGKYGKLLGSHVLLNEGGRFKEVTSTVCPEMAGEFGNVSAAVAADFNKDGAMDLALAGEWMSVKILLNVNGKLQDQSEKWGLKNTGGWWNVLSVSDIDQDGDADLLAGNLGWNTKFKASVDKPFFAYLGDFDKNGSWDTYLGSYDKDGKVYPVRGRQCSSEQMPFIAEKYKNYESFAVEPIEKVLDGKLDQVQIRKVEMFESGVFINEGGKFSFRAFPAEVQIAPVNDFVLYDFNKDGIQDIAYGGNYHDREVETTRSDAGIGGIMLVQKGGELKFVHPMQSGFFLNKDVRKMKLLKFKGADVILTANNNELLQSNFIVK